MRAAIGPKHRHYFTKNHSIEFEDLVKDLNLVYTHVDQVLTKRTQKNLETRTPKELFMSGRDLFRDDLLIRKITLGRHLGQIASLLFDKARVRIAYDQALRTTIQTESPFTQPCSLTQMSCFQPLLCGVIIRLSNDLNPPNFFPQKPGNVVFFQHDFILPWTSLFQVPNQSFILIAYAPEKCRYVLQSDDLHTHALKKIGLGFGDALTNETHPLVFK